ncbi:diacylglycerol kinase family lipid kinase [Billgrantia diversa]|uniref:diacylglycerol/lipid kinase family protein n=1 Tax=Halomonas sp. MCCC 1A13316 TaxID=2733487 RepID=UPI0018A4BFC7|nr:diacylglycerol kinase family protein [Halomonas sp. MCCC 1A13316]QOR40046.1 diacylglycerol kinase family lipid kinase [Halomonas sp. MCCC 1A13316]
MNYWLIVNDTAGDGRRGEHHWREHLEAAGLKHLRVGQLKDTDWEREVEPGDRVLVAGGDGSVGRVATVCIERKATMAVLPSGTANDFARNLVLPEDPAELCRLAVSDHTASVDVAWINDRLYLNVAHIGLGTMPAREATHERKQRLGRFSYLITLAQRARLQRGFSGRIECDNGVVEGRWLTIAIASGAYFGGGHSIAEARIDDGRLDVIAVRHRSWFRVVMAFLATRLMGHTPHHDDTLEHLQSSQCHIQLQQARTLTADGETLGRMSNVSAFTRRGVLRVACHPLVASQLATLHPAEDRPPGFDAPMVRPNPLQGRDEAGR